MRSLCHPCGSRMGLGKYRCHADRPEPEGALGLEVGESRDPHQGGAQFYQSLPFPGRIRWLQASSLCKTADAGIGSYRSVHAHARSNIVDLDHLSARPVNCAGV